MKSLIIANRFGSYEQAREAYNALCDKFGATRIDWGFGRWLWLEYILPDFCDELTYWRELDNIGILTSDGRKRLARAEKNKTANQ